MQCMGVVDKPCVSQLENETAKVEEEDDAVAETACMHFKLLEGNSSVTHLALNLYKGGSRNTIPQFGVLSHNCHEKPIDTHNITDGLYITFNKK